MKLCFRLKRVAGRSLCAFVFLSIAGTFLFVSSSFASDGFAINDDGTVQADASSFADLNEYVQSDYFKENGKRCGTKVPEGPADPELEKSISHCTYYLTSIQNEYWPAVTYVVPIWFHVITMTNGTGYISDQAIIDQVQVLNEDYRALAGTMGSQGFDVHIQFELAGITRTQNDAWFTDSAADEAAYKKALNKDPSKYINIYTNDASGYLGYAYFPQTSAGQYYDGIVLLYSSVGGRNNGFSLYDQGRTLVHEMGHFMGLFHTFQDTSTVVCLNSYTGGDLIVDTPSEEEAHFDCTQTYTCGTPDPIHNYMDYTNDTCMYQFTSEQANRAVCSMVNYRPSLYSVYNPGTGTIPSVVPPVLMPMLLRK